MKALKEWASVVKALEDGNQTVLLRKGGILETASGFQVESNTFALFPTYEHQEESSLKAKYSSYIEQAKKDKPREGFNRISSIAEVLEERDISSMEKLGLLSPFHIWSDSYITERMNWLPKKPMKAIFLKVFKIEPCDVPVLPEYHGCKSWIELNVNLGEKKPVLSEALLQEQLLEFRRMIN